MKRKGYIACFALLATMMAACSDDELATSPSDQPTLSADTLHMGMVLAGNSSSTSQLKLYNRCSDELRLTSISLRSAGDSGFRMNVDGMNGSSFVDSDLLRIAKGDSMFIFVEATFPDADSGLADCMDYIDIVCNGRTQTIVLDAQSKGVKKLYAACIMSDTTWTRAAEVQIFDSLVVAEGVTLTLTDSVTLYLHDKADLIVRGTLLCQGRLGAPVTIRGDRTDRMFVNLPYDNLPAQWGSLYIAREAKGCRFEYTDIRGMSGGIDIDSTDVVFGSCRLKNANGSLITCRMSTMTLDNCELSNALGSLLDIYGGWHDIRHCTMANYYFAGSAVTRPAVHLCNADTANARLTPLHRCDFLNTLIWGRWQNPDVSLDYLTLDKGQALIGRAEEKQDSVFAYTFDHCLLRADGTDDNEFVQTVWNADPLYRLIDTPNYAFDFHLTDESPAREAGAPAGSEACPTDLDGVARPEIPSIGCYQWTAGSTTSDGDGQ